MKTHIKILIIILSSILLGNLVIYYFIYEKDYKDRAFHYHQAFASFTKEIKTSISGNYSDKNYKEIYQKFKRTDVQLKAINRLCILDTDGKVLVSSNENEMGQAIDDSQEFAEVIDKALRKYSETLYIKRSEGKTYLRVIIPLTKTFLHDKNNPTKALLVAEYDIYDMESVNPVMKVFLNLVFLFFIPALFILYSIKRYYEKPMEKINERIKDINIDNLGDIAVIKDRQDEVSALNFEFGEMQNRLKNAIADISIEIKDLKTKNRDLITLQSFSQKISNIIELVPLKESIINFIIDDMRYDAVILLLWLHKDSATVSIKQASGISIKECNLDLANPEDELVSGKTLFRKENILEKIGIKEDEISSAKDDKNLIYLILKQEKKIIGILGLAKKPGESFTMEDIELNSFIARSVSVCVHRALLYESAITDSFTGFYLKRYFDFLLSQEVDRSKRYGRNLSVVCIELENFDNLIGTYSPELGDFAIKQLITLVKNVFRKTDIIARFSENLFAIVLPETDYKNVLQISERFQERIGKLWITIPDSKIQIKINVSMGISIFPSDGETADILVKKAYSALGTAKTVTNSKIVFAQDNV